MSTPRSMALTIAALNATKADSSSGLQAKDSFGESGDLVDRPEPGPYVRDVNWPREVPYRG